MRPADIAPGLVFAANRARSLAEESRRIAAATRRKMDPAVYAVARAELEKLKRRYPDVFYVYACELGETTAKCLETLLLTTLRAAERVQTQAIEDLERTPARPLDPTLLAMTEPSE